MPTPQASKQESKAKPADRKLDLADVHDDTMPAIELASLAAAVDQLNERLATLESGPASMIDKQPGPTGELGEMKLKAMKGVTHLRSVRVQSADDVSAYITALELRAGV
jgi:hypothetical protein